jgi:hypothetical protein
MQHHLDWIPQASIWRRRTVKHPFGTIKAWMGATHFLTKTLPRVRTEKCRPGHELANSINYALPQSLGRSATFVSMPPLGP